MPARRAAKTLQEVVDAVGIYPLEAFLFVQQGLNQTVEKLHGVVPDVDPAHHIGGKELCDGLRQIALEQWGRMARTVLARWKITTTLDFGHLVFAMVAGRILQTTENDKLDDFRDVYDFATAFETDYRFGAGPVKKAANP